MSDVEIDTEYVTLGQLLKMVDVIQTGGQAKYFLQENSVYVNDQPEQRRGRKIYPEDHVKIEGVGEFKIIAKL